MSFSRWPALCVAALSFSTAVSSAPRESWSTPREPFRLVGNTWYVGTQGITVLLIRGEQGSVLIDAAVPDSAPTILASLAALDVAPEEIKLILTSHAHDDHVGSIAALAARTGARVVTTPESAAQIAAGGRGDLHFGDASSYPPMTVDGTLTDGQTLRLGELEFTAHRTPGHTPGSTTWTWKERQDGRELSVLYADSITAPGYRLLDHPKLPDLVDQFRATFETLRRLPCDVLVTPHPDAWSLFERVEGVAKESETASETSATLVDPTACRRYADRAEKALDAQIESQRVGKKQ